jgi:PAS domain S-box-containing protein
MLDLARAFAHSREIGFVTDLRGAILEATRGAEKALGYGRPELVGLDLPHLAVGEGLKDFFGEKARAESRLRAGFQLRAKSGRIVTIDAVASCLRGEGGEPLGWFFAGQDLRGALAEDRTRRTLLDALVDSIGAALWSVDRSGTVVTWSRSCEAQFGYVRSETEGKLPVVRLFPSPEAWRRIAEAVDAAGRFAGEVALVPREGEAREHQLCVTRLASAEGLPLGYTAVSLDIAERKRLEEFQRVLFERVGEAILVVDPPTLSLLDANDRAGEILGYPREELLRLSIPDIQPTGRSPEIRRTLEETGRWESPKAPYRRKDGTEIHCEVDIRRFKVGGREYSIVLLRDLSERRRAEEFYRVLFQKSSDALYLVEGAELRVIEANEAACRLLGYAREELLALRVPDLVPPEKRHLIAGVRASLTAESPGLFGERRLLLRKDGASILVSHDISRMDLDGRVCFLASARDLTEQVRAEEYFRVLFEKASSGILVADAGSLSVVAANEKAEELLGCGPGGASGRGLLSLSPDFDRQAAERAVAGARSRGEERADVLWLCRSDGTAFPARASLRRLSLERRPHLVFVFDDVSERLRTATQLEEAKIFLERFRDDAVDAIVVVDDKGAFQYVNEAAVRLLGRPREELLGATFVVVTPADLLERHQELFRKALAGEAVRTRTEAARPDGTRVPVDVTVSLFQASGRRYVSAIIRDIAEQVRKESELEEARAFLERLQDGANDGMAILDDRGTYVSVNSKLLEISGRKREDYLGRNYAEEAPAEYLEGYRRYFERLLAGESVRMRTKMLTPQGVEKTVDVSSSPLRRGGRTYVFAIVRDITEQARTEEELERRVEERTRELRESEERFRGAFHHMGVGMALVGIDGRLLQVNPALCEMLGYAEAELVGKTFKELTHPDDQARSLELLKRFLSGELSHAGMEKRYLHKTGYAVWTHLTTTLVRDAAGAPAYFVSGMQDITLRKEAEETLKRTHEDLERRVERRTAELRESEAKWRSLVEHAPDFILTADREGRILFMNHTTRPMTVEDVLGKPVTDYVPEGSREMVRSRLDSVFATGRPTSYEVESMGEGGKPAWYISRLSPILDKGEVVAVTFVATDITARKASEDRLRRITEEQELLLTHSRDFVYRHDREGVFTYLSPSVEQITGYSVEDWRAHYSKYMTDHPLNRKVVEYTDETLRSGKQSPPYLVEVRHRDGRRIVLEVNESAYREEGRIAGVVGVARDVTERQRTQERLAAQHAVTRILAEAATLDEAAPRVLQAVGELLGWDEASLWRPDAEGGLGREEGWRRAGLSAAPSDPEFPGRVRKEARPLWSDRAAGAALGLPLLGGGRVLGVALFEAREARPRDPELLELMGSIGSQLGQFVERRQAEEQLRFQKTLLESQSEAAIDGILVVSNEGVMVSFNRRFVEMWGIPPEAVASRSDEAALRSVLDHLVDPKGFLDRVRHLYEHPDEESRDEILLKDGRTFDRYSAPVRSADGILHGRVWYFRDVTGRKKTELELRRAAEETRRAYEDLQHAQAQLIRSEKLASIGMLVSGVAHEINNPLNVMYGNLQLLAESPDLLAPASKGKGRKFRGMIRDALKAAEHARRIVEEFRSFARDTRKAEPVDLNVCLEETAALFQRELRPSIRLAKRLRPLPRVRCFPGQMNQVFLNLLKNAAEAIEKKGTITLRSRRQGGKLLLEVSDTGRGMDEEIRRKLFEPFFTTKPVGKGLGLGLSISAMIVQNHGGQLSVQSRPGRGSTFRIELPLPL